MKVVVDFIDTVGEEDTSEDHVSILKALCRQFLQRGYTVEGCPYSFGMKNTMTFKEFDGNWNNVAFYLCNTKHPKKLAIFEYFRSKRKALCYAKGGLFNSLWVDMWSNDIGSNFSRQLPMNLDYYYKPNKAAIVQRKLAATLHREPSVKDCLPKKYLLILGQPFNEIVWTEWQDSKYLLLILEKAKQYEIPTVYRPRGLSLSKADPGFQWTQGFLADTARLFPDLQLSSLPEWYLMERAEAAIALGHLGVAEGAYWLKPVLELQEGIYTKAGASILGSTANIEMLVKKQFNQDKLKKQQLKLLWWFYLNLLLRSLRDEENFGRLEMHIGRCF